jgi:FAD/FMN-containing dehydrogenase
MPKVKYCTTLGIPFLVQNSGIRWAKTFRLGKWGVLIDLAGLNTVTVAADKKTARIEGGASIGDTIAAANVAGALVMTGNCNCVGALGAMLGGGYGRFNYISRQNSIDAYGYAGNLMGEVRFGVDNIISMRVVISTGEIVTVSAT